MEEKNSKAAPAKKPLLVWRVQDAVLNVSGVVLLCGILVFMVLQIVTRYIFNNPLKWTEEFTRYFQVWLTFIGGVIMVRDRASIAIDAIVSLAPRKVQKALYFFTTALSILFLGILAVYGVLFVRMNLNTNSLVTNLNMGLIYSVIPLSAVLMIVNMLRVIKEAPEWTY